MSLHSRALFWGAALLIPPVALVLLWLRNRPGAMGKLAGSLALLLWTGFHLVVFFGMRLQSSGTGFPTIVTFESQAERFRAVDQHRSQQKEAATVGAPAIEESMPPAEAPAEAPDVDVPRCVGFECWTEFRGPERAGKYLGPIVTVWGEGLEPLWRQPAGGGYASFAVAGGRAFTIEQRHANEVVAAYDVATGREIWTHSWPAFFQETLGGDGPRATPTWSEGFVYALGAEGELRKLAASDGKQVWRRNILEDAGAPNVTWGMAASPLVVDGMVVTLPGGRGASVVAYDAESGEIRWRALDDKAAYTAPMIARLAGIRQLLVVTAHRVVGLRPDAGELLWEYPWTTQSDINVAQPLVVDENHVFLSAAYGHGAALVEVRSEAGVMTVRTVWSNVLMKNKFTSSVLHEGYVYGLDEAILACLDVGTGRRMWKGGRYGYGQLVLASGHLVVVTEGGELALVRATPEKHEEMARFSAIEGKTWNHPALADGILLVRNLREMAAFDVRPR